MSTSKVIFTYKRKRLSSCSGAGNAGDCPNFTSDVQGKDPTAPKESSEKDPMITEGVNIDDTDCSMDCESFPEPSSQQHAESKLQVPSSDACNSREIKHGSNESSEDNNCKASGKNVNAGETSQENTKGSCLAQDSSRALIDGSIQGGILSLKEDPGSLNKHRFTRAVEVSKGKSNAPLLTFSRRLKKKADAGNSATSKGAVAVVEKEASGVPSASHDETLVENSSTIKVAAEKIVSVNMSCQSRDVTTEESKYSSYLCTKSSADIPVLRQTAEKKRSQDDLVVDVTKQSVSALSGLDPSGTTNVPKDIVLRLSDGEISSCDNVCKTDELHVSNRCQTSSGDSQLTSNDCADVKTFAEKAMQPTASSAAMDIPCPPSGGFVIDCNVIPESDLPEKESDTAQHSSATAENRGKITQEEHQKRKGLELFNDTDLQIMDSSASDAVHIKHDQRAPSMMNMKPDTRCLQLFSEDGRSGQLTPLGTNLESDSRRAQQNTDNSSGLNMGQLEQAARKASAIAGLSLGMEPMYEGQTSRHGSGVHPFQDHNVGNREYIQNPALQNFPDQSPSMFQHNAFPDTCNTRATALRGNRNISLDRFDPGRTMWSEEELDSLWIGIRRHGRGNWHAMLLDPKLRFAPWRVARDLAAQWDREQCNLFTGQPLPDRRCQKPPDEYNSDFHGRFMHPRVNITRDLSETHLSLGDVYARKEGNYFGSNGQNQSHIHVTLASNSFNPMHTSVMIGGHGIGSGPNSYLPHWLRDPAAPASRYVEPSVPMSTVPPTGGPQPVRPLSNPSGASSAVRNLNNYMGAMPGEIPPPGGLQNGVNGPSRNKQNMTADVIVIDSDASSEETISDDQNPRN